MDYPLKGEVICAPDSFKGTLTAEEAADALARGVRSVWPAVPVRLLPLADGGEGSLVILQRAAGGTLRTVKVEGPLGDPVEAAYLRLVDGTAVVEMAQASGLLLVDSNRKDPERASTFGTGELIRAALDEGALSVLVCLGGSATTDGGAGMAEALGYRLLDAGGAAIGRGGGSLLRLDRIDPSGADSRLGAAQIVAATDVTNTLYGRRGAAAVYGPQKGAGPAAIERLDRGLRRLAEIMDRDLGLSVAELPGSGAAGGLGGGLVGFCGARLESGAEVLMDAAGLPAALRTAALCLTGEGQIDEQSIQGKLIGRLARRCREAGVPLLAIGGRVTAGAEDLLESGVSAMLEAGSEDGMPGSQDAAYRLERTAANGCRLIQLGMEH